MAYEFSQIAEFIISVTGSVHRKREKAVTIIEYWRSTDDFIRVVVNEIAKIAKMLVGIEYQRIKEEYVGEATVGEGFVP